MTSEIQLDHRNMCTFVFPTREKLPALIDTGSTKTLIAESLVQQSVYLRSLPVLGLTEPVKFVVGNGSHCASVSYIEPDVYLGDIILTVVSSFQYECLCVIGLCGEAWWPCGPSCQALITLILIVNH